MPHKTKYKIIAAFLLTAFSLNTVVGFACSIGVDMGYNTKHHDEEATEAVVHIHADGKKHTHYEKKKSHNHDKPAHHDKATNHHKSDNDKENCCNEVAAKLGQVDKSVPESLNIIHPVFLIAFFDVFYSVVLPQSDIVKNIKQFLRGYHPPISDLRIAIQSFQI